MKFQCNNYLFQERTYRMMVQQDLNNINTRSSGIIVITNDFIQLKFYINLQMNSENSSHYENSSHFYVGSNISHRDFNQFLLAQNSVSIPVQNTNQIISDYYQGAQNEQFHDQLSQSEEVWIKQQLEFKKYKKNFLPIFLKGYEKYLSNTKDYFSQLSLYQKVDNVFNNLKGQGKVRFKYGIKLIQDLLKTQNLNFIKTVNDYRRTYAPLYFMKKIAKKDFERRGKQIYQHQLRANTAQYMKYLHEPFPPKQLENHLENKNCKTTKTAKLQIYKQIQKPQEPQKTQKGKNIYRDLNREIRKIINYKGNENVFELNQKGLYDFFKQHKEYFIADKYLLLQETINKYLIRAQNDNQKNKIQKYLNYVEKEINQ
ncbi:hypothetical protein pb186bvf_011541 [Paramecium bursaria]